MSDDAESADPESPADHEPGGSGWSTGSFLAGILVGAAVGAGVALLLAPASGQQTRRALRRKARAISRDAAGGWVSARQEARQLLRDKKAALRERIERVAERLE
jgi:gas vesicle protein